MANRTTRLADRCLLALKGLSRREKLAGVVIDGLDVSGLVNMKDRAVIIVQGDGDNALATCERLAAYWNGVCPGSTDLEVVTPEEDEDLDEVEVMVRLDLDYVAASQAAA